MEVYFELSNKSKNSGDEVLAWCNSGDSGELEHSFRSFGTPLNATP
jgi:hypothetical protein